MSRRTKEFFLAVLFVLVLTPSGLAQTTATTAMTSTASMPSMQMTNIPYFSLRDGMDSTLTLNNLASQPTVVNVTIFNTHGEADALAPMTLPPRAITELDLSKSVRDDSFDSGNVEIAYNGQMMQVTAQVSIFSVDKRVDIESREADMMDFASSSLAGILSMPREGDKGYVAITNVASQSIDVRLSAGERTSNITLSSRETRVINLKEDLHASSASLIRLTDNGLPGDIIATAYVLNEKTGYSSAFWMVDPASAGSNTLAGVHFWAGTPPKAAGFPDGTYFHSPLLLANVSTVPVNAQVFINATQTDSSSADQATAQVIATNSPVTSSQHVNVGALTIPPGGVQTLDLADAAAKLGSDDSMDVNGLEVTYDGAPGSLIGHLTSSDASGNYSFEVPVRDPAGKDITPSGGYPWTLQNGTNTTLHLMNTTDKKTSAIVEFRFPDGTKYDPDRITLQPHQALAIDIQKLRGSKQADLHNNLFAATQDHGQLVWIAGALHALVGRAEQVNVGDGFARSFSCGQCVCPNTVGEYSMVPTGSSTFTLGYDNTGSSYDYYPTEYMQDCYGYYYGPYDVSYTWSSANPSIATVQASPGDAGGDIDALAPGSTTALNDWTEEGYRDDGIGDCIDEGPVDYEVGAAVNAGTPDHVSVVVDNQGIPTACPSTGVWVRQIEAQIVDKNNTAFTGNPTISESYSNLTTNSCGNGQPEPSSACVAESGGEYIDTMTVAMNYCDSGISESSGCGYSLTSTWSACGVTGSQNLWTSSRVTDSNQVTVNGNSASYSAGTQLH